MIQVMRYGVARFYRYQAHSWVRAWVEQITTYRQPPRRSGDVLAFDSSNLGVDELTYSASAMMNVC